ncbi:hypothetical protein J3E71DRAFT_214070 [Bipolaris maydis]|nr:hypothetical protein J3E71DRAFT_214070 [Bipolaris maydis]
MSKDLVLITGATGHVGFGTLVALLEHGYRARIVHRRQEQVDKLKHTASLQKHLEDVEFVLIPDFQEPSALEEAVKGVSGIIHVAAPIPLKLDGDCDWQKHFYDPAKKGTLNLFTAAAKEPSVKRIVVTSTCGITEYARPGPTGPLDIIPLPDAETAKKAGSAYLAYQYSKAMAYYAALEFIEIKKPHFDVVHMLLGYVQGANELYSSAQDIVDPDRCGSNNGVMLTARGILSNIPRMTAQVHLSDVARAHVLSLKPENAKSGDNFILAAFSGQSIPWKEFVPIIRERFPDAIERGILNPDARNDDILMSFDVSNSEAAFGKFLGSEEMVQSVVGQYIDILKSQDNK